MYVRACVRACACVYVCVCARARMREHACVGLRLYSVCGGGGGGVMCACFSSLMGETCALFPLRTRRVL